MKKLIFLILVMKMVSSYAVDTRYYGGHIQITHVNDLQYEIEVKLFTDKDSLPPQQIDVDMGDGFITNVSKTDSLELQNNTTLSFYKFTYSFSGAGSHTIFYHYQTGKIHAFKKQSQKTVFFGVIYSTLENLPPPCF
jgi:hypothetical protein